MLKDNKVVIAIFISALFIGGVIYLTNLQKTVVTEKLDSPAIKEVSTNQFSVTDLYKQMKQSLPDHQIYCIPEKKSSCGIDGCESVDPKVFVLISESPDKVTISRCDNKPCDTYDAIVTKSGAYMSVDTIEPHGMIFKTSVLDGTFVEIVTLGTDSLVSNGHCYSSI